MRNGSEYNRSAHGWGCDNNNYREKVRKADGCGGCPYWHWTLACTTSPLSQSSPTFQQVQGLLPSCSAFHVPPQTWWQQCRIPVVAMVIKICTISKTCYRLVKAHREIHLRHNTGETDMRDNGPHTMLLAVPVLNARPTTIVPRLSVLQPSGQTVPTHPRLSLHGKLFYQH